MPSLSDAHASRARCSFLSNVSGPLPSNCSHHPLLSIVLSFALPVIPCVVSILQLSPIIPSQRNSKIKSQASRSGQLQLGQRCQRQKHARGEDHSRPSHPPSDHVSRNVFFATIEARSPDHECDVFVRVRTRWCAALSGRGTAQGQRRATDIFVFTFPFNFASIRRRPIAVHVHRYLCTNNMHSVCDWSAFVWSGCADADADLGARREDGAGPVAARSERAAGVPQPPSVTVSGARCQCHGPSPTHPHARTRTRPGHQKAGAVHAHWLTATLL